MSKRAATATLSFAALAAAQSLSSACTSGLTTLQSNDEANKCLALNQFSNIFLTPSGQSVINPVNNWLVAVCGAAECSDATLKTVVDTVTTACATDLAGISDLGVSGDTILPYVQQYFSTGKKIICLANTTSDSFCETELATKAEAALGTPLTLGNLFSIATGVLSSGESPVNASLACTDCTKGAISILRSDATLDGLVDFNSISSGTCGADFAASATSLPANIVVGTGTAVPKGTGGSDNKPDGASTLAVTGTLAALAGAFVVAFLA